MAGVITALVVNKGVVASVSGIAALGTSKVFGINGTGTLGFFDASGGIFVANYGGCPGILEDLAANRPAAGTSGRIFIATDTKLIERDNGASWDTIGSSLSTPVSLANGGTGANLSGAGIPTALVTLDPSATAMAVVSLGARLASQNLFGFQP